MQATSRLFLSSLLLAGVLGACVSSDDASPDVPDPGAGPSTIGAAATATSEGRPISDEEMQEIAAHPRFREVTAQLAENGSSIDLRQGSTFTYEGNENAVEILFHPTDAEGNPDREFSELVFQREGAKDPFAFTPHGVEGAKQSLAPTTKGPECAAGAAPQPPAASKEDDVETQGCTAWSSWYLTHTACEPRFWCFAKNQQGTYSYWQRHRYCNWGTQISTRRNFVGCGC